MNNFEKRWKDKNDHNNRGLLLDPIVEGKDGVFGGSVSFAGKTVVRPDGQWEPVEFERQFRDSFDSYSCVSFGRNNQEEVYLKNRYGLDRNFSDRAMAKMSDTQPNGNTPQKVYEARRKQGYLYENEWPWPDTVVTWAEYMKEIPSNLMNLAKGYSYEWRFWHDYVPTNPASMKEALKYSPIGVSNNLWQKEDGTYYKPDGLQDSHWALVIGYDSDTWKLLDTYPPFIKRVKMSTVFQQAKIIEIDRQVVNYSAWDKFVAFLRKIWS
mgnify:CR=1 FL=1